MSGSVSALEAERIRILVRLFVIWGAIILLRLIELQAEVARAQFAAIVNANQRTVALIAAAGMLTAGKGAAWWKQRSRESYRVAEIGFGTAVGYHVAVRLISQPGIPEYIAAGSAIYIIARGFGNVAEADRKRLPYLKVQMAETSADSQENVQASSTISGSQATLAASV